MWNRLKPFPLGKVVFNRLLFLNVPYSGTIQAKVCSYEKGASSVQLKDRRSVRNHLQSIHAIALANLGELTTGLAALSVWPPTQYRTIVVDFRIEYLKKARGALTATSKILEEPVVTRQKKLVTGEIKDKSGDTVANVQVTWLVEPK